MQISKDKALSILEEECQKAQDEENDVAWESRIQEVCLMSENSSKTYIAVLGTHILAKSTNLNAHTMCIDMGDRDGGYSARNFCKEVLAAHAPRLNIDLGVRGREPFQNNPFDPATYIDDINHSVVASQSLEAFKRLKNILRSLDDVDNEQKARKILRAFLRLRIKPQYELSDFDDVHIDELSLIDIARDFVNEASEFGKRAQAMTAAIMDAKFGHKRVFTERVHDPDRNLPGDVVISSSTDEISPKIVFEVRDKPVEKTDLYHAARKASDDNIVRVCVVAVATAQNQNLAENLQPPPDVRDFANARDMKLRIYTDWSTLIDDISYWSNLRPSEFASQTFERLPERAKEMEVSEEGIEWWISHAD